MSSTLPGNDVQGWLNRNRADLKKQVDDLSAPAKAAAAELDTQAGAAGFKDHNDRINWLSDMSKWNKYALEPNSQQDPVEFRVWLEQVLGMPPQPAQQWAFKYTDSNRWGERIDRAVRTDRLTLTPSMGNTRDLQALVSQTLATESLSDAWALGEGASRTTALRAKTSEADGLAVEFSHVDPAELIGLTQADLTRELRVPVEDSETGQTFDMVLRPKHIIFIKTQTALGTTTLICVTNPAAGSNMTIRRRPRSLRFPRSGTACAPS